MKRKQKRKVKRRQKKQGRPQKEWGSGFNAKDWSKCLLADTRDKVGLEKKKTKNYRKQEKNGNKHGT